MGKNIIWLIALLLFAQKSFSQDISDNDLRKAYLQVSESAYKLESIFVKLSEKDKQFLQSVKDLKDITTVMQKYVARKDSIIKRSGVPPNKNGILELKNYARLFESLSKVPEYKDVKRVLSFIDDDLFLKTDVLRDGPSPPPNDLVTVKVRVLDSTGVVEMSGYDVFVKPEISLDSRLIETFNPTNNAIKKVLPGRKLFWIEKNGKLIKNRPEGISITAETPVVIDFIVK